MRAEEREEREDEPSSRLVYREIPFAVPMGEGSLATGQIDLAYRKAGGDDRPGTSQSRRRKVLPACHDSPPTRQMGLRAERAHDSLG